MFSKLFSLMMLFCIGATFINAQTFEAGKTYTYRSRFNDNGKLSDKTQVLSVIFDEKNNATITRTTELAKEEDKLASFAPIAGIKVADKENKIKISNLPNTNIFAISFSGEVVDISPRRAGPDLNITIRCACAAVSAHNITLEGDGKCRPSMSINSGTYFCDYVGCIGCCDQSTAIQVSGPKSVAPAPGPNLFIVAASVILINK